jgi:anti-anti-sigma factor
MEIKILKEESDTIAFIKGRVDTVTAPELENQISPLYSESGTMLILDCANMEYISSSGLRVILTAHKQLIANGGKFKIRHLLPEVRTVFDMTGFSRILTIE